MTHAPALEKTAARRLWLRAQRLDTTTPFGTGADGVRAAVEHLGYVQIDTIHVIERAHHHILWSRIPAYHRNDLGAALSREKSVFEYWTHALAYVPTRDLRFFLPAMRRRREAPATWFRSVDEAEVRRLLARIRRDGPLSIRDIDSETLVERDHPWASRKPAKRALERAFFDGRLTVSAREGMVKTYELSERHFGWPPRPRAAVEGQILAYFLARALRAQGVVSLNSICYMDAARKKAMAALIDTEVRRGRLVPVAIPDEPLHWATPEVLADAMHPAEEPVVHILSPFDPLVIQRRRLEALFGYLHLFEAYLPAAKRQRGYFALPVLVDDRIAAVIDLKTDRAARRLLIQQWTSIDERTGDRPRIDAALGRFETFQLAP